MIWTFKPFSTTKELGKTYNAYCSLVVDNDDWILIMDSDCCMLTPLLTYRVIENAIIKYPDTQIFGAMTNRVGYRSQCVDGESNNNMDIKYHYDISLDMAQVFPDGYCIDTPTVAGFFLLFRKRYWMNNKFQEKIFDDNGVLFDYNFCKEARRVKIIRGAYIFHAYRLTNVNDLNHLR